MCLCNARLGAADLSHNLSLGAIELYNHRLISQSLSFIICKIIIIMTIYSKALLCGSNEKCAGAVHYFEALCKCKVSYRHTLSMCTYTHSL